MEEFPANSHKSKGEPISKKKSDRPAPKEVKKVISGNVVRRKKPLGKRFAETFVGGDAQSVWSYVTFDVLIPAAKDMISDAISQGVEKMLFGEVRGAGRSRSRYSGPSSSAGRTNYNSIFRREEPRREPMSRQARATHNFDEIVLETRAEANEVIDGLYEIISTYDTVTVADLYEMIGQSGNFTDEKWGWTDIRGAGVVHVRGGYLLDLPRPIPLD